MINRSLEFMRGVLASVGIYVEDRPQRAAPLRHDALKSLFDNTLTEHERRRDRRFMPDDSWLR